VRVKLLGAPPDSYFDFSGFSFQTPMNGSRVRVDVAAGRGFAVAGFVALGFVVGFGAGPGVFWAVTEILHNNTDVASTNITIRHESRMVLLHLGS
jgi:hypothetical protein